MPSLLLALLSSIVTSSAFAQDEPPEGMVLIPAGEFVMGSDDGNFDEAPAHRVRLSAFYIDEREVTNARFAEFVRESGSYDTVEGPWFRRSVEGCLDLAAHYQRRYGTTSADVPLSEDDDETRRAQKLRDAARWRSAILALRDQLGEDAGFSGELATAEIAARPEVLALVKRQAVHPVRYVAWRDAAAFAKWAGKRLPTEAEWEKAARGTDERRYPWGNTWDAERCHAGLETRQGAIFDPYEFDEGGAVARDGTPPGPAPVGRHPDGASPYGCLDMAGNVWEWVADWYGEYYYRECEGAIDPTGPEGLPDGRVPDPWSEDALLRTPEQGRSTSSRKVIRGGGWAGPPRQSPFNTKTTRRLWSNASCWHDDVGFRCAKDGP